MAQSSSKSLTQSKKEPVKPDVNTYTKPFLQKPSLVDYDSKTKYISFGKLIEKPPKVVHPRRYKTQLMPIINEDRNACYHQYCMEERLRICKLRKEEKPLGLPWASGFLKYLPGHQKYKYPLQKSYVPKPKKKKPKAKKPEPSPSQQENLGKLELAMDEMIYFYKMVMIAGMLVHEAKKEKGIIEDSDEENEDASESKGKTDKKGNSQKESKDKGGTTESQENTETGGNENEEESEE